jgi:polyribonucleotide nucleotidyltransferase
MIGGKHKNISNRDQGYVASSEPNSPTIASPGYTILPKKQDTNLKSFLMMLIEDFKDINNSFKEIWEKTGKQLEALKEETQKSLKELQENTTKQVKELNKIIEDLKMEIEIIKKSQRETTLDASITKRIQEIEERISGAEDIIETLTQQSKKMQKAKCS